jgi:hypothetical protein
MAAHFEIVASDRDTAVLHSGAGGSGGYRTCQAPSGWTTSWAAAAAHFHAHSQPWGLPLRAKRQLHRFWEDPDPSRGAVVHGNGEFGRRAWGDHWAWIRSPSFPLLVAADLLCTGSGAVDLTSIAAPTDKNLLRAAAKSAPSTAGSPSLCPLQSGAEVAHIPQRSAAQYISSQTVFAPP